jgi:hypothetical protein
MEDVEIFYGHFVYFMAILYILHMAIWYICWLFGIFFHLGILCQEKSGNSAENRDPFYLRH